MRGVGTILGTILGTIQGTILGTILRIILGTILAVSRYGLVAGCWRFGLYTQQRICALLNYFQRLSIIIPPN